MVILPQNIMCHLPLQKAFLETHNIAYIDFLKSSFQKVFSYKNVKVFDFLTKQEFVCDFKKYHDTTHFYPFASKKILEDISANKHRFKQEDIKKNIVNFKKMISDFYDYSDKKMKKVL